MLFLSNPHYRHNATSKEGPKTPAPAPASFTLNWTMAIELVLFTAFLYQNSISKRANMGFKVEAWLYALMLVQEEYQKLGGANIISLAKLKAKVDAISYICVIFE